MLKMRPGSKYLHAQFKALGCDTLPSTVTVEDRPFRFVKTFKHSFAVAVALYEANGEKVVVKLHRQKPFFGIPLKWAGELMASYENAVLKKCHGVDGVPDQLNTFLKTAVAHDYIPGHSLRAFEPVEDVFFERLFNTLNQIHKRGIAYVDLEKPENILKGDDGYPYFIDFQVAFYWPSNLPPGNCSLIRAARKWLQRCDYYHACKHLRRMRPGLLNERQRSCYIRKPWPVKLANAILKPWQILRKLTMDKRRKREQA